jgi:hypothetical protein
MSTPQQWVGLPQGQAEVPEVAEVVLLTRDAQAVWAAFMEVEVAAEVLETSLPV